MSRARPVPVGAALAVLLACGLTGAVAVVDEFDSILASVEPGASNEQLARLSAELAWADNAVARFLQTDAVGGIPVAGELVEPTVEQRRVLAQAARLFDSDWVVAHVTSEANEEPPASWRRAALDLLRWHASPEHLLLLGRLAAGAAEASTTTALDPLGDAFHGAVVALLRRDPRAYDQLSAVTDEFETLRGPLVRAVGSAASPEGLGWLLLQVDRDRVRGIALQELRRLAPRLSSGQRTEAAGPVRPYLRSQGLAERTHAARTLASLGDPEAVPALISMLEEGSRGERRAACSALRELSGRRYPERAETWRAWYDEELRWLEEESAEVLARLSSDDEAEVIAAVRVISDRGLRRDHWARQLALLLTAHASPAVRSQVSLGLGRLGSRVVADDLALALGDPEPAVRRSACSALRAITGLSLPPEREAWREALSRDP